MAPPLHFRVDEDLADTNHPTCAKCTLGRRLAFVVPHLSSHTLEDIWHLLTHSSPLVTLQGFGTRPAQYTGVAGAQDCGLETPLPSQAAPGTVGDNTTRWQRRAKHRPTPRVSDGPLLLSADGATGALAEVTGAIDLVELAVLGDVGELGRTQNRGREGGLGSGVAGNGHGM